MIREIAHIEVLPGKESDFEAGVRRATLLFLRARGGHALELQREIEHPQRYRLVVTWSTVEDHTVHFRASPEFQEWRRLVGAFFAKTPEIVHVRNVQTGA